MNKTKTILFLIILLSLVLRVWNINSNPAGFNADEASLGYNAYSILKTGKDEYGTFLPLVFKSFGDYKPGLYVYLALPFVAVLGLNELAVRLPSIIFAILTVLLIYFLTKEIFKNQKIALLSALLLAICPWHIQFSRGAWESNVATFFITLGIFLFIKSLDNLKFFLGSMIAFLLAMYTYQSPRLVVPVIVLFLFFFSRKYLWQKKKSLVKYLAIAAVIAIPLGLQSISSSSSARFSGLSFFSDIGPVNRTNELVGEHQSDNLLVRLVHNKVSTYVPVFMEHYLDHFSSSFWFINGDEVIRNKVPEQGQFYLVEALFLIVGLLSLITVKIVHKNILLVWILAGPLASSLTFQTPSALRSLNMVIPLTIVMAFGAWSLWNLLHKRLRFLIFIPIVLLLVFETVHFLDSYFVLYPKRYPLAWEYGFDQMVSKLETYQSQYQKVVITDRYDQPYILVLFYEKYDPAKYQPQANLSPRDKFNFGTITGFDKYQFHSIKPDEFQNSKDTLFVGTGKEIPKDSKIIDQVNFPDGSPAFIFASPKS